MEKKIFVNKTIIQEKEHRALNNLIFITKIMPMIIVYMIMSLIFTVYGLIIKNSFIAIFFAILLVIIPIFTVLISKIRSQKLYNKFKELYSKSMYTFTFYESNVKVELIYGRHNSSGIVEYKDLKVTETNEFIFLFVSPTNAYVVNKKGFEKNYDSLGFKSVVLDKVKKYKIKK